MLKKRSVSISGHNTSISLEEPFWRALGDIAAREGVSLAGMISRIDTGRGARSPLPNLSSAIRVFVLEDLQRRLNDNCEPPEHC